MATLAAQLNVNEKVDARGRGRNKQYPHNCCFCFWKDYYLTAMADFIRGAFGVSRSSSERRTLDKPFVEPIIHPRSDKEKLHASPSTGSDDNVDLGMEEFDPFGTSQTETDDVDGSNNVTLIAPPEKE